MITTVFAFPSQKQSSSRAKHNFSFSPRPVLQILTPAPFTATQLLPATLYPPTLPPHSMMKSIRGAPFRRHHRRRWLRGRPFLGEATTPRRLAILVYGAALQERHAILSTAVSKYGSIHNPRLCATHTASVCCTTPLMLAVALSEMGKAGYVRNGLCTRCNLGSWMG